MSDSEESDVPKKAKSSNKRAASPATSSKGDSKKTKSVAKNDGESDMFEIGSKRFVRISEFRGNPRVDIREYYTASDGETKPGRKGISLSVDQFRKLVDCIPAIENQLNDV